MPKNTLLFFFKGFHRNFIFTIKIYRVYVWITSDLQHIYTFLMPDTTYIDDKQLEVIGEGITIKPKETGGPQHTCPTSS